MPTPFAGMTAMVTGIQGSPVDILQSMRTVLSSTDWLITDRVLFSGDSQRALRFGATVDKRSGSNIYTLVFELHYGYRLSSAPTSSVATPERAQVSVTLTYQPVGSETVASDAGYVIDSPPSLPYTVLAGQAIPPLVLTFDEASGQVIDAFYGRQYAFVASSMWPRHPPDPGVTDRFAFRFDPAREDVSPARMLRGCTYGGSFLSDADGTHVRLDLLNVQTGGGSAWNVYGAKGASGWWLTPTLPPATSANWPSQPDGQHADAGFGPLCMAYSNGGPAIQSHSAYHFAIKQHAARWLAHFPEPDAPYANEYESNYWDDEMRAMGRVPAMGAHLMLALHRMQVWRPSDPEVATLLAAVKTRTSLIFRRIYDYRKGYALPGEPASVKGTWQIDGAYASNDQAGIGGRLLHPERGYQGIPADPIANDAAKLKTIQLWMGGLFCVGIYQYWQALADIGEPTHADRVKSYELMKFITIGDGCTDGMFDVTYRWKGTHPKETPSPFPPSWSIAPASQWPAPATAAQATVNTTYGWAQEYNTPRDNLLGGAGNIDSYVAYLTLPTLTTGEQIAMFELCKRELWLEQSQERGPADYAKLDQIIADYANVHYRWHLQTDIAVSADADELVLGETVEIEAEPPVVELVSIDVVDALTVEEETPDVEPNETVYIETEHTIQVIELDLDVYDSFTIARNSDLDLSGEVVTIDVDPPEPEDFTIEVTESMHLGPMDLNDEVSIQSTTRRNTLPTLRASCISVLPALRFGEDANGYMERDQDFTIQQGDDVQQPYTVELDESRVLDGSESWLFVARRDYDSTVVMLRLSSSEITPSGGTILRDPATWEPIIQFGKDDMPSTIFHPHRKPQGYPYNLQMTTAAGKVQTGSAGRMIVVTDIAT